MFKKCYIFNYKQCYLSIFNLNHVGFVIRKTMVKRVFNLVKVERTFPTACPEM